MNTLKFLLLGCPLVSSLLLAQQNDRNIALSNYQKKIDSIVSVEKTLLNEAFEKLEKEHSEGLISKEQLLQSKKEISEKSAEKINKKLDEQQQIFKDLTKKLALTSVYEPKKDSVENYAVYQNDGVAIQLKTNQKKEKHPKTYLNKHLIQVNYAFINLTPNTLGLNPFESDSKMRIGNSHSVEVMSLKQKQLGKTDSPFFIRYGLSYRADTYMPKRPLVVSNDDKTEQIYLSEFTEGTLKRSKLRNVYLTIPVDFYWVLNPKYTDYQGEKYIDGKKKQWRLGVGMYAGVNLRSIVKVKYYDHNGDFEKYKYTLDYGVNRFLFGVKMSVKYGGLDLYIKKDLTPIFNDKAQFPYKNGIHLGINLGGLIF